jgi:phosphatidylserine/phosphatidylglycerophosphate/cardiolipin synthase-like enzyme
MEDADSYSFLEDADIYEAVVVRGILVAKKFVDIATANVKDLHVPSSTGKTAKSIVRVFRDIARRGVRVRLLHSGVPSERFIASFRKYGLGGEPGFTMRRCIRVHFKCAVFDGERAYIGSANLTGAGFGAKSGTRRNFELGIITTDPLMIQRTENYFEEIFSGAHCEACGRKNVCYVPLEEPDL